MNIVEKVKKLLALSESDNPNEAALAAGRAQELMVKYAIDEAALQPAQRNNEPIESEEIFTAYQRLPVWHALLAYVMAPAFFCRSFYTKGNAWHKARIWFVGQKTDRMAAIATYNYLKGEITRLCERDWAKTPAEYHVHGKRWKTAFYEGCCREVQSRLGTQKQELAKDANTAIVLASKQKAVDDYVAAQHKLTKGTGTRNIDGSGYTAGREAGKSLNLNPANRQLTA